VGGRGEGGRGGGRDSGGGGGGGSPTRPGLHVAAGKGGVGPAEHRRNVLANHEIKEIIFRPLGSDSYFHISSCLGTVTVRSSATEAIAPPPCPGPV
jgi:hypothetical protein